jgi:hypothetical protein
MSKALSFVINAHEKVTFPAAEAASSGLRKDFEKSENALNCRLAGSFGLD